MDKEIKKENNEVKKQEASTEVEEQIEKLIESWTK